MKEALGLARIRADQVLCQCEFSRPFPVSETPMELPAPTQSPSISNVKRLMWDKMLRRRAQGLYFNCPKKFTAGHKGKGLQLLLLEGSTDARDIVCEGIPDLIPMVVIPRKHSKPMGTKVFGKLSEVASSSKGRGYMGDRRGAIESD